MNTPYTVVEVKPEWRLDQEQMGSKRKFWYSEGIDKPRWLFKYAREITPGFLSGEHWAEKIAEQVAEKMGIPHAKVELAVCQGSRGSTTESFTNANTPILVHGNELLSFFDKDYESFKTFKQKQHTLDRIFIFFNWVSFNPDSVELIKRQFAEYLVLDALVSNVDRHHENWGVLFGFVENQLMLRLAPSFDHASSLGRELTDERRQHLLTNALVGQYVDKGSGAIFRNMEEKKAPSPLELVQYAVATHPLIFTGALKKLGNIKPQDCETIVERIPGEWMSPCARRFAKELLCHNLKQLTHLENPNP